MNIKIDARETELIKKMEYLISNIPSFKEIKMNIVSLPLGDIIINNGEEDKIIIERKSIRDLSASIKDGRYEEQSYRLNGSEIHNHNIIYLIEGNINQTSAFNDRIDKLTIYSAIFSILYYKGFSILRSTDMDETATILCNMTAKLCRMKDKKEYYTNNKQEQNDNENENENENEKQDKNEDNNEDVKAYCKVVKKIKKENITKENIGEIMLCQIPGISSQTAIAILEKFKNIANLIKCIENDDKCLNEVCTVDKKNKSRKISKNCIVKIINFLK